jgi:hypothetical protein
VLWHKQWVGSATGQNRIERTRRKENDEDATDQEKYEAEGNSGVSKTVVDSYVKKGTSKRIFRAKESVLTYLCSTDKNVEAFYHVFMVMICTAIVYSLMKDSVEAGK